MDNLKRLNGIVEFTRRKHLAWAGWPLPILREYIATRLQRGEIIDVWGHDQVVAVAVGWPQGDGLHVAGIFADPGTLPALLSEFVQRYPNWAQMPIHANRRGRVRNFNDPKSLIRRLIRSSAIPTPPCRHGFSLAQAWEQCCMAAERVVERVKREYPNADGVVCIDFDAPPPRDMAQEGRDTLQAQIDLAPQLYASEAEYRPKYAALELSTLQSLLPGLLATLEQQVGPAASRIQSGAASRQRAADVGDVLNLAPQSAQAMREVDPARAALLDQLTSQASDELGRGAQLDPDLARQVSQSVRAGQAARGFGYGNADVFAEAMGLGQAGQALRNQRRAFAGNVIGQRSQVYGDPFLQILGRPSTVNPQGYMGQAGALSQSGGPRLFDPWSAYGADLYNTNYNAEAAARIGQSNAQSALIGSAIEAVGNIAGGFLGCWVAREVYGPANPRWLVFRHWLFNQGPAWFRGLYLRYGPAVARLLRNHPWLKPPVRLWMDGRIASVKV